ncbi:MAG: glycosyltransferase family 4 protein [Planctomycetota bacterium]
MKIGLCFSGCYRRGGVERVVLATANGLARRGHDVHVFARVFEPSELDPAVTPHPVPAPSKPPAWELLRFGARCAAEVRRSGLTFDALGGFGVACPATDLGWVQSVHARWLECSRGPAGGGAAQRLRRRLNPFHAAALRMERRRFGPGPGSHRRLLALSREVADDLSRFYGVADARITRLPNGVDTDAFHPARAAAGRDPARRRFGLTPDDRVLVFVANESPRKGLPSLIEAVARRGDPRVKLLAAGRLPQAEVRRHAARRGVEAQLRFTGPLDDVAEAYAAGDVFVLPTHYEAWGLVIVEALACGLPVVTTRRAGAAEAIDDGRTGRLIDDPGDVKTLADAVGGCLAGLPSTPAERHEAARRYRWERIVQRYETALREAAEPRRTPGVGVVVA